MSLKYKGVEITSLTRNFLIALGVISGIFLTLVVFSNEDSSRASLIKNLHLITRLPSTVNSTPFLEKRISIYNDFSNRLNPQMSESTQGSFVYAQ